jgi:Zn-dependent protease with chaperone function
MQVDRDGFAKVGFWLSRTVDQNRIEQAIQKSLSFPVKFEPPNSAQSYANPDEEFDEDDEGLRPSGSWTLVEGKSLASLTNQRMKSTSRITLDPLIEEVRATGVKKLSIMVMFNDPDVELSIVGGTKVTSEDGNHSLNYFRKEIDLDNYQVGAIEFSYGYGGKEILRRSLPLMAFVLFVALLTLFVRRSVLRKPDLASTWGGYFHFCQLMTSLIWLVWIPICAMTGLSQVLLVAVGREHRVMFQLLNVSLYIFPPLVCLVVSYALSKPIYNRITGVAWSPREVMKRAILMNAVSLMPLFILLIVIGMLKIGSKSTGIFLLTAGVAWVLSVNLVNRLFRASVYAISAGELRNRIFELAHKAGVAIKQIYVLPNRPSQLSNAFARSDNAVMLSASLLKHLSKREVDAIMAHEIGHLKEKHPQIRGHIMLGVLIVTNIVASSLSSAVKVPHFDAVVFSLGMLVATLILHFVSRSNERHADAISIGLTGDPEAYISGLARLCRLNLMPLNTCSWGQSLGTHPRTFGRLQDIARLHGITEQRFQELIAAPETNEERYSALRDNGIDGKVFSSDVKKKLTSREIMTVLATMLVVPAFVAMLLSKLHLQGAVQWTAYVAGVPLAFLIYLGNKNLLGSWRHRSLGQKLRNKLEAKGLGTVAQEGVLVGLAPAARIRKYENHLFWDAGLLWLSEDKLVYVGEETTFALDRQRIIRIYARYTRPEWLASKAIFIEWSDESDRTVTSAIHFLRLDAGSVLSERRAIDSLNTKLQAWLKNSEALPRAEGKVQSLREPSFAAITSEAVADHLNFKLIIKSGLTISCMGAIVAFAFRLSFADACYSISLIWLVMLIDELAKVLKDKPAVTTACDPVAKEVNGYTQGAWAESQPATAVHSVD